ncbi:MAG: NAD(P)H-dependent oxidoreductase [Spirochaetes bacterium]|nr:NAD(P)H-dependent oxidoreductase [Spirochaetota bacterium]MBL7007026.1 NAD(P)H-dependent oxidoreductase [Spirochaetia bacterium]
MRVLVITATPSMSSFNYAIAEKTVSYLTENGHDVVFHDLYREKFPPLLEQDEIAKDAILDPLIAKHCEELTAADGVVIIHPNWWGQPPAILKGWIDRVIRPGTAYICEGKPGEVGEVIGLLKGKFGVVFTTGDTDTEREISYFMDPLETLWKNCIFGFCGVVQFTRRHFNIILTSSAEQRKKWLADVENVLKSYIG